MADETARILVEFLEVAVTSVVFVKGVYPSGAFERRRYLNVVVHRAKHPQLRDYSHSAVTSLLPFIQKVLLFCFPLSFYTIFYGVILSFDLGFLKTKSGISRPSCSDLF